MKKGLFFLWMALLTSLFASCPLLSESEIGERSKICVLMPCAPVRKAIVQKLKEAGFRNIIEESCPDSKQIQALFERELPECVIVDGTDESTAARTLIIDTQALYEAKRQGVKKCFLLTSFAVYPARAKLPFKKTAMPMQNSSTTL